MNSDEKLKKLISIVLEFQKSNTTKADYERQMKILLKTFEDNRNLNFEEVCEQYILASISQFTKRRAHINKICNHFRINDSFMINVSKRVA